MIVGHQRNELWAMSPDTCHASSSQGRGCCSGGAGTVTTTIARSASEMARLNSSLAKPPQLVKSGWASAGVPARDRSLASSVASLLDALRHCQMDPWLTRA